MPDPIRDNDVIFRLLSVYLNLYPDAIDINDVNTYSKEFGFSKEFAFAQLLATYLCLDLTDDPEHKALFKRYFIPMVHMLDIRHFTDDSYYRTVSFDNAVMGAWELRNMRIKPAEAFVCNDPVVMNDGRIIPQIGFFDTAFEYPAVLENGREWMTLMPNETVTSAEAISKSRGDVLTFGLGLGYFAFKAAEKDCVRSVTVVEKDENVIKLFVDRILPLIPFKNKIKLIHGDAFEYAAREFGKGNYDFVFTDIWHDPSDGCELYLKMKEYEKLEPKAEFSYWLEKTLRLYIDGRLK